MDSKMQTDTAIKIEGLVKSFGKTRAVDGIDLEAPAGKVLGLLGPNGSGKTTTVRMLATLLRPDAGRATIAGYDVVREAANVRALIGLTGQYAAVDEWLSGQENLELIGKLLNLTGPEARRRADELLERFDLTDAARRPVKTYSGGMRRRLDLAASIVGHPTVLFLDEPTTGLDPQSRLELWAITRELVADGTTVMLTTQYLDEADELSNDIVVLDRGRVIARGTSDQLKSQIGGRFLELRPSDLADLDKARVIMSGLNGSEATTDRSRGLVHMPIAEDGGLIAEAVRRLDDAGVGIADLSVRQPSLDDVFLKLTGRRAEDETAEKQDTSGPAKGRGRERTSA
jgi:oleandomycin transport system ATP-binding protein